MVLPLIDLDQKSREWLRSRSFEDSRSKTLLNGKVFAFDFDILSSCFLGFGDNQYLIRVIIITIICNKTTEIHQEIQTYAVFSYFGSVVSSVSLSVYKNQIQLIINKSSSFIKVWMQAILLL